MTGIRQMLAVGLLTAGAFIAGQQFGRIDPVGVAPAPVAAPRTPAATARATAPAPAKPASPAIDLGDGTGCGQGGPCLDKKYLLLPLRAG
jgi:hypothetical protein